MKNLKLEELSTEQKIGMLLCARSFNYSDENDVEYTVELIRNHSLGCVQVPFRKPDVVKKILETADYPIIMVLDMEMGFPTSKLPPIPMMTLAACNKPEYYRAFARAVVTESNTAADELAQEMITRPWYQPDEIIKKIGEEFPEAEIVTIPEFSTAKQNEKVLVAATRHKEVVFVTFCTTRPYLGTDCLTRRTEAVINSLAMSGKLSTVLHFGNPFALKTLYHIPRKIFGYMMPQSQPAAIEALSGKLEAKGTLPFNVEFQ